MRQRVQRLPVAMLRRQTSPLTWCLPCPRLHQQPVHRRCCRPESLSRTSLSL